MYKNKFNRLVHKSCPQVDKVMNFPEKKVENDCYL